MPREWFITRRKQMGLTQQGLVDKVVTKHHVTRQHISAIERNESGPSPKLAKVLGEEMGFPWVKFYE